MPDLETLMKLCPDPGVRRHHRENVSEEHLHRHVDALAERLSAVEQEVAFHASQPAADLSELNQRLTELEQRYWNELNDWSVGVNQQLAALQNAIVALAELAVEHERRLHQTETARGRVAKFLSRRLPL